MTPPTFDTLDLQCSDSVATLTLNRPAKSNALDATMWEELRAAFAWADSEETVRVVVLCGAGKHFCAGIDLALLAGAARSVAHADRARSAEKLRALILRLQDCITALERCRKPVLAAIHGACVGGAVDLVCAADMRYASADARFAVKEIDVGMVADVGTLQRLPRLIAPGIARELALTGRMFDAAEASRIGFVNRVFDTPDALRSGVGDVAAQLAAKSPLALRGTKQVLNHARDHSVADGLDYVATWNAAMLLSADLNEAGLAAREQRAPRFGD